MGAVPGAARWRITGSGRGREREASNLPGSASRRRIRVLAHRQPTASVDPGECPVGVPASSEGTAEAGTVRSAAEPGASRPAGPPSDAQVGGRGTFRRRRVRSRLDRHPVLVHRDRLGSRLRPRDHDRYRGRRPAGTRPSPGGSLQPPRWSNDRCRYLALYISQSSLPSAHRTRATQARWHLHHARIVAGRHCSSVNRTSTCDQSGAKRLASIS